MHKKATLILLIQLSMSVASFGQTHLIDSLRDQLKTVGRDTNRSNILTALIKASRIDYPDTAILYSKQAHDLATELHDNNRIAGSYNLLGTAYYYQSEFALAEEMQRKSLAICTQFGLTVEMANTLGSLALALQAQSKFQESIETYYQVLKREEDNHNMRGLAKSWNNLAILYRNLGDYGKSLKCGLKSYKIIKQFVPDWDLGLASVTNTIGLSYLDVQRYDSAIIFITESYRINKKINNVTFTANTASNITHCYLKQKNVDSAARYIEVAYQLLPKISSQIIASTILINMGGVKLFQNKLEEALKFTKQGMALAESAKIHERRLNAYTTMAEIYSKRGDYKNAYVYSNRAYKLNDSLKVMDAQRKAANLERDYEIKKKQESIDILGKEATMREAELKNEQQVRVYLIFSIILLIITAGATYYGFRQKIKSNKRLKAHSDEIAHKNELLESVNRSLQDQAMRSQMKPHFIFNALNSIQFLILQKENDKAFDYLSKFSQLLRSALEFSDRDFIELDKELKWLELYVQIEALRFNQGFDFKVENSLQVEEVAKVNVPPFLIQPFLENAIAHGLMTKSSDRLLILKIYRHNSHINISIADNGIGREASATLKAGNGKKHKSFAMDLVAKRLEILKAISGREFTCTVTDGINATGEKEGTVVNLQLPG